MKRFIAKVSKSFKGGEKGFTLIELLIVIVILGVLAAAIIPNLSKFVGSGKVGAANAELASVKTAASAYQADNDGDFPTADGAAGNIVEASIQTYISGTDVAGTYSISATGVVTGLTYPDLGWDCPNEKWATEAVACP